MVANGNHTEVWDVHNYLGPDAPKLTTCCIASDCMMWRKWRKSDDSSGYCGLGGVPT
jgi:hypothetical protein